MVSPPPDPPVLGRLCGGLQIPHHGMLVAMLTRMKIIQPRSFQFVMLGFGSLIA